MALSFRQTAILHDLLWQLRAGLATSEQLSKLERLVCEEPEARTFYVRYLHLCADLYWNAGDNQGRGGGVSEFNGYAWKLDGMENCLSASESAIPAFPMSPSITLMPSSVSGPFVGGPVFSYMVASVVLCFMLLGAWAYKVSQVNSSPSQTAAIKRTINSQKMVFVGRITDIKDCVWAKNDMGTIVGASVPLGRKYSLSSGLLEIIYTDGARVILEGPCEYTVNSHAGGYLAVGKLTARVEKRGERRGERKAASGQWLVASAKSQAACPESPILSPQPPTSSLSTLHSPLFTVSTPTAIVTDLGTEFGVEVSRSHATRTHVFQGKIEVRPIGDNKEKAIQLGEGESALVEVGEDGAVSTARNANVRPDRLAAIFTRRMPKRVKIGIFNTGIGLKEGDADPHWHIITVNKDKKTQPRPAVVTITARQYKLNDPARSQWISVAGNLPDILSNTAYTFRTQFELADALSGSTVLHGGFLADNHVAAIRLNGHDVHVPEHQGEAPFIRFVPFKITEGFVKGTNVLEIDVFNGSPFIASSDSPMALRAELWGFTIEGARVPTGATNDTSPSGRETERRITHE